MKVTELKTINLITVGGTTTDHFHGNNKAMSLVEIAVKDGSMVVTPKDPKRKAIVVPMTNVNYYSVEIKEKDSGAKK